MKIVGLDMSITSAGIAWITNDGYGSMNVGTAKAFGHLTKRISHSVHIISEVCVGADVVFIEDYAYGKQNTQGQNKTWMLGEMNGALKHVLFELYGHWLLAVNQSTIKSWLGHGQMKKDMMPVEALKRLGAEFGSHDEYVAYSLADLGWHAAGGVKRRPELTKKEMEVIKRLRKTYPELVSLGGNIKRIKP